MTIKITKSQADNRRVRLVARFNDASGHSNILDMLQDLHERGWNQSQVLFTALQLLHDSYANTEIYPLSPDKQYVTSEMLQAAQETRKLMAKMFELIDNLDTSNVSSVRQFQSGMDEIRGNIDLNIVEGAGSYSSQIAIREDDDFGEWA